MKVRISPRLIALCGLIAAIYTALCLATPLLSYGMLQVRVAEALTLLPVLTPAAIGGVTLGCAVSNLVGWLTGANPIGYIDAIVGTFATLLAAVISYKARGIRTFGLPLLSALAPVVCNGLIIGAELSVLETGGVSLPFLLLNGSYVALGELIACAALGIPLVLALERRGIVPGNL